MSALELRGLRKSFGGLPATDDVTLDIAEGERRLIIGPNGAGKTTLFNLISGDLRADAGSVVLFGEEVAHLRPDQRAHRGLARTYQIITLFAGSTLADNIVLALLGLSRSRWQCFRALRTRRDLYARAGEVLSRVGLERLGTRRVSEVSYGEKRRLEIAMALAQDPRLLLLDEPLAGLSTEERRTVQGVLEAIPRDISIVMIEHDMDTALAFAERITVLHYGKVIVEGTRAEVVAHPRTREVYLGA
ncbi:MAG: ABC transporter ATP-binding protein [Betaproteobacteria bacterium]